MKELIVRKIDLRTVNVCDIPDIFQNRLIKYNSIDFVNWRKEYPYKPIVKFAIAHQETSILLHFHVEEENTEAIRIEDGTDVWNDSCVEFFIKFGDNAPYYNIEVNCIGTCLIAVGEDKNNRTGLSKDVVSKVKRWSSLGNQPVNFNDEICKWDLCLEIPKEIFLFSDIQTFSGIEALSNFYKCGDELATSHFLSWNKINSASPNFHLPEYFGKIRFE